MKLKSIIARKIPIIQKLHGLRHLKIVLNAKKQIEDEFKNLKNNKDIEITNENIELYKKTFLDFIWYQPKEKDIALAFANCEINAQKKNEVKLGKYDPILLCIERNDLSKIKILLQHHRKIGVKKFIFIDNESDDGTIEFLEKQKDVDLYICHTKYKTLNKEGWANRILAHYGFDKWYLYVDSDELFIYDDCENKTIDKFIEELEKTKQKRVPALLTDMYSKENIFSKTKEDADFRNKYCYYDFDTYSLEKWSQYDEFVGGPRKRLFGLNPILTKYPLFKLEKGDIQALSHWQFPYKYNYNLKIKGALLHYKFLDSDLEKYIQIAKEGNYSSGSIEYKTYISTYNERKDISFFGEHSKKYTNSKEFFKSLIIKNSEED